VILVELNYMLDAAAIESRLPNSAAVLYVVNLCFVTDIHLAGLECFLVRCHEGLQNLCLLLVPSCSY